jgi:hypothetical protein
MKRTLAWAMALATLPFVGFVSPAGATGAAACTISGTITFTHSANTTTEGVWTIAPAIISCNGLFNGYERILGPGKFTGTGSYSALPGGSGTCLRNVGSGAVDYTFPTTASDVHLHEPNEYTLDGVGTLSSPSLKGTFQMTPPFEGDCVTKPITRALFLAEASLVRFVPPDPNRYLPPKRLPTDP